MEQTRYFLFFFLYHLKSATNLMSIFILMFSLPQLYPQTTFVFLYYIFRLLLISLKKEFRLYIFLLYYRCH